MNERDPKTVFEGTVDNGQGVKTFVSVAFCPPSEPTPIQDIFSWTAQLCIDNTTQVLDLPTFLKIAEMISDEVVTAARQNGLLPPK